MIFNIPDTWQPFFDKETDKDYFIKLESFVASEYNKEIVYPPVDKIFSALDFCSLNNVKVVIVGQDPYHGKRQANGLSFSVEQGTKIPPSLRNIFKEINSELGLNNSSNGDLSSWAKQGVLLLNSTFTVREKQPGSHQNMGWETFSDNIISKISEIKENVVFVLWGKFAEQKQELINEGKHLVLKSSHPSPFSAHRGFFGNNHFKKINTYLNENGKTEIDWSIKNNDLELF